MVYTIMLQVKHSYYLDTVIYIPPDTNWQAISRNLQWKITYESGEWLYEEAQLPKRLYAVYAYIAVYACHVYVWYYVNC